MNGRGSVCSKLILKTQPSEFLSQTNTLTACVFQSINGVGEESHAAEKSRALLLMDLLMVPHADGDGVRLPNIPAKRKRESIIIEVNEIANRTVLNDKTKLIRNKYKR